MSAVNPAPDAVKVWLPAVSAPFVPTGERSTRGALKSSFSQTSAWKASENKSERFKLSNTNGICVSSVSDVSTSLSR